MLGFLKREREGDEELDDVLLFALYFFSLDRLYIFHLQVEKFCVKLFQTLDSLTWTLQ